MTMGYGYRCDFDGRFSTSLSDRDVMVVSSHVARIKNFEIESLRGLAIILMVAGHVIGSDPERGMQVPETSGAFFMSRSKISECLYSRCYRVMFMLIGRWHR